MYATLQCAMSANMKLSIFRMDSKVRPTIFNSIKSFPFSLLNIKFTNRKSPDSKQSISSEVTFPNKELNILYFLNISIFSFIRRISFFFNSEIHEIHFGIDLQLHIFVLFSTYLTCFVLLNSLFISLTKYASLSSIFIGGGANRKIASP